MALTKDEMNLNQGKLAQGLTDEILALIHQYDESLYLATVLGVLEIVKTQLITDHLDEVDE
jgi:ABC-type taurine transport system ATPase subunit